MHTQHAVGHSGIEVHREPVQGLQEVLTRGLTEHHNGIECVRGSNSTITWDKQPLELVIYAPVDSDASVGLPLTAPEETTALEYIWPSAKGGRRVIAGLTGCVNMGHLYVSLLWVDKSVRGTGLGRRLMQRAEEEARRLGCDKAFVDTQSFQSPGFYARLEYEEMYRVRGCFGRKDIDRIYFGKSLVRDETD